MRYGAKIAFFFISYGNEAPSIGKTLEKRKRLFLFRILHSICYGMRYGATFFGFDRTCLSELSAPCADYLQFVIVPQIRWIICIGKSPPLMSWFRFASVRSVVFRILVERVLQRAYRMVTSLMMLLTSNA